MTTIAYDGRYLAADGRRTKGGMVVDDNRKKLDKVNGTVCVATGLSGDVKKMIGAIANGIMPDTQYIDADAIYIEGDSLPMVCGYSDYELWSSEIESTLALGAGNGLAYAAMDLGKNAMEAVAIAAKRDLYTGGTIRYYDTQDPDSGVRVWSDA